MPLLPDGFPKWEFPITSVRALNRDPAISSDWAKSGQGDAVSSMRRKKTAPQPQPHQSPSGSLKSARSWLSFKTRSKPNDSLPPLQNNPSYALQTDNLPLLAMAKTPGFHERQSDEENTRDSAISGLSILDDDTDDFYQQSLKQLSRDQRRLQDATNGQPVRAFSRARPQANAIELLANWQEHTREEAQPIAHHRRNSTQDALPKRREDAPNTPNVPKEWGRKGKQRNDFLRRINSTGDLQAQKDIKEIKEIKEQDDDRIFPRRTLYTGDSPDSLNGDASLESVERGSPTSARRRRFSKRSVSSRASSSQSVESILGHEQREARAAEQPSKATSIDTIPERKRSSSSQHWQEIDNLRERGVTTSRLAEVGLRNATSQHSLAKAFRQADENDNDSHLELHRPEEIDPQAQGQGKSLKKSLHQELNETELNGDRKRLHRLLDRPKHRRQDSRDLLRQLARVSSLSPSPPKYSQTANTMNSHQNGTAQSTKETSTEAASASKATFKDSLKRSSSARADLQGPQTPSNGSLNSGMKSDPKLMKTPMVTGAWIDTPRTQKPQKAKGFKSSQHPRSALEAALRHASQARTRKKTEMSPNGDERDAALDQAPSQAESTEELGEGTLATLRDMMLKDPEELKSLDPGLREQIVRLAKPLRAPPPSSATASSAKSSAKSSSSNESPSPEHALFNEENPEANGAPRKEDISSSSSMEASASQAAPEQVTQEPNQPAQPAQTKKIILPEKRDNPSKHTEPTQSIQQPTNQPLQQPSDAIATPAEEELLWAMFIEDLALQYLDPSSRALPAINEATAQRWNALHAAAQKRSRSLPLLHKYATQTPAAVLADAAAQTDLSGTDDPTVLNNTLAGSLRYLSQPRQPLWRKTYTRTITFLQTLRTPGTYRPSARGYLFIALLLWYHVENILCSFHCHPYSMDWFPDFTIFDMQADRPCAYKPFVTYEVLLYRNLPWVFGPIEKVVEPLVWVPVLTVVYLLDYYLLGGLLREIYWAKGARFGYTPKELGWLGVK